MPQDDFGKMRLKKGEMRSIKADLFMVAGLKETKYGRAAMVVQEENRGTMVRYAA